MTDVCDWLKDIRLGEHVDRFMENEILGEHLFEFSKQDLQELGVRKLGHQKTFTAGLSKLTK